MINLSSGILAARYGWFKDNDGLLGHSLEPFMYGIIDVVL